MNERIICPYCSGTGKQPSAGFFDGNEAPPEDEFCSACHGTGSVNKETIIELRLIYLLATHVESEYDLKGGWEGIFERIYHNVRNTIGNYLAHPPHRINSFSEVDTQNTGKEMIFSKPYRKGDEQLTKFMIEQKLIEHARHILGV